MRLDALVEGVRSGAIESVMFPQDIVANAPRILSDLRAFFPPEQGKFLVGPMVKINSGGSGASAGSAPDASPKAPDEAKKQDDLTQSSYDDNFEDPLTK